jgi:hypothetical protein
MDQFLSELNDAPYKSVYYATITDRVDLLAASRVAGDVSEKGCPCWAVQVVTPGDLVYKEPGGALNTIHSDEWIAKVPMIFSAISIESADAGTTAAGIRVWFR